MAEPSPLAALIGKLRGCNVHGEPPYDIFVRWKPLHQQAIGWDPHIMDGVSTLKWSKDRGKEPKLHKEEFPWSWN